jgi:peroxiredoxin
MRNFGTTVGIALAISLAFALSALIGGTPAASQGAHGDIPDFYQDFIIFYSKGNLDEMWRYVHPDRGLVQNGYLLTYEDVEEDFKAFSSTAGKIDSIRVLPDYGFYPGENYYRARCWVEYTAAKYTQRIPTVFVFEKIDDTWYLVQSEMEEFTEQFRDFFEILTMGYILPDIELTTNTNRLYNSGAAAENGKASLLFFFSLWDIYGEVNIGFFFDILAEYGSRDDIYVFAVTDDDKADIDDWMERNDFNFVWLYDEKSLVHYDLGIMIHPMLLLLDKEGRLVLMSSWKYPYDVELDENYRTGSQKLIMKRVAEVLSEPVEE